METTEVISEMKAYLDVLRRSELTELDLDALSNCLGEAIRSIEAAKEDAESGRTLRDDLISEVIRYSRASCALVDGVSVFDSGKLRDRLLEQDTETLLSIRKRVRAGFMRLLRSNNMPRKTVTGGMSCDNVADYKLEDVPV